MLNKLAYYGQEYSYCAQEMSLLCARNVRIMVRIYAYYAQEMSYHVTGNFCDKNSTNSITVTLC